LYPRESTKRTSGTPQIEYRDQLTRNTVWNNSSDTIIPADIIPSKAYFFEEQINEKKKEKETVRRGDRVTCRFSAHVLRLYASVASENSFPFTYSSRYHFMYQLYSLFSETILMKQTYRWVNKLTKKYILLQNISDKICILLFSNIVYTFIGGYKISRDIC